MLALVGFDLAISDFAESMRYQNDAVFFPVTFGGGYRF